MSQYEKLLMAVLSGRRDSNIAFSFEGEDVLRLRVVGLVKGIFREL